MIVEDEQHFHDLYTAILEDTGYGLIHAYDGYDALSKLEEKKPDLIILDILLNTVTGDTLFLHLKSISEYADIPVVIISARSEKYNKTLRIIDPKLVYIEKLCLTRERLLNEVEKKFCYSSN
jgi:DNA-binding response OmpR family regulator